jgi:vacuolar-type H+-ATPase subunit I/STV1
MKLNAKIEMISEELGALLGSIQDESVQEKLVELIKAADDASYEAAELEDELEDAQDKLKDFPRHQAYGADLEYAAQRLAFAAQYEPHTVREAVWNLERVMERDEREEYEETGAMFVYIRPAA